MSQEWARLAEMLVPDRHRTLLDEVRRRGSAQVAQLAASVGVSSSTVRRDLAVLEAEGLLLRARGGAYVRPGGTAYAPVIAPVIAPVTTPIDDTDAKARVGSAAAGLVDDGMTIMILAGSTTATMLPLLAGRSLTVVTNGLGVAQSLAPYPEITLVLLGGVLHREQMTLLGPMTARNMADLHVDVLFGGAWGVHPEVGVTGVKVTQAGYHHSMLRHASTLVVLATAEKLGRQGPTLLARTDQVDTFITDDDAPADVVDALRAAGSSVLVC